MESTHVKPVCTEREFHVLAKLADFEHRKEQRTLNYARPIARELDMSERTVQRILRRLEDKGLVRSELDRKTGRRLRYLTDAGRHIANKYKELSDALRRTTTEASARATPA